MIFVVLRGRRNNKCIRSHISRNIKLSKVILSNKEVS